MRKLLPLLLLLMSPALFAQTYTQSTPATCLGTICNGLPLDQGGVWQFIKNNAAFSINSNGFYIFGNPGVAGSGGISNYVDDIPEPPNLSLNGSTGAEGTLTFDWMAVNSDFTVHYSGHADVQGHKVRKCTRPPRGSTSCITNLVVDSAQVFID